MTDLTPENFSPIFRDLVRALQPPKHLDRETERVYWETLQGFSADILRESAQELRRRERPLWPTSGEWYRVAAKLSQESAQNRKLGCMRCGGRGLLRVAYRSGEPFDIAVCACDAGRFYRRTGPLVVRAALAVGPEHQVADLEAFDDGDLA